MMARAVGRRRSFLFLQGCTSPFFGRLADKLANRGHAVSRINFNVGDAVYWGSRPAWNFRDGVESLPAFLEERIRAASISDVVMLGDTRPVHLPVPAIASSFGVRVHVLEEGYFRPNWLTLECGGINGNSPLPRDPDWYRRVGPGLPDLGDGEPVSNPVALLALDEAIYHLPNLANPLLFPGYRTHRPFISGVEFFGWGRRFARLPLHQRADKARIAALISGPDPFFLLPLQLDSDTQITVHSPFATMAEVIEAVMKSFATYAEPVARLVIKNHPLDTGLFDYARLVRGLELRFDVAGRVHYLEAGHLPTLLAHARGVVTVNSTVGTSALFHRRPTIALGKATYGLPGLTFQGPLDRFWRDSVAPDVDLFRAFRRTVIHAAQVNGGFYTRDGIALGVENCLRMLEPDQSPLEQLLR
jgi:capsular polysaccharide export protein